MTCSDLARPALLEPRHTRGVCFQPISSRWGHFKTDLKWTLVNRPTSLLPLAEAVAANGSRFVATCSQWEFRTEIWRGKK